MKQRVGIEAVAVAVPKRAPVPRILPPRAASSPRSTPWGSGARRIWRSPSRQRTRSPWPPPRRAPWSCTRLTPRASACSPSAPRRAWTAPSPSPPSFKGCSVCRARCARSTRSTLVTAERPRSWRPATGSHPAAPTGARPWSFARTSRVTACTPRASRPRRLRGRRARLRRAEVFALDHGVRRVQHRTSTTSGARLADARRRRRPLLLIPMLPGRGRRARPGRVMAGKGHRTRPRDRRAPHLGAARALIYHVPFSKMAKKAQRTSGARSSRRAPERPSRPRRWRWKSARAPELRRAGGPSLLLASQIGNTYTGSLYLGLPSLLHGEGARLAASVSVCSRSAAAVRPSSSPGRRGGGGDVVARAKLDDLLRSRRRIDVAEYERIMGMPKDAAASSFAPAGAFRFAACPPYHRARTSAAAPPTSHRGTR